MKKGNFNNFTQEIKDITPNSDNFFVINYQDLENIGSQPSGTIIARVLSN